MQAAPGVLLDISHSIYKWLMSYQYFSEVTNASGALKDQFSQLTIVPDYPSDLMKVRTPQLAVGTASSIHTTEIIYGELAQNKVALLDLYGFVVGQGSEHNNARYLLRLMNDVTWLFDEIARHTGLILYKSGTTVEIGQLEVDEVRCRRLEASVPTVEVDRYKFVCELEIPYTAEAALAP